MDAQESQLLAAAQGGDRRALEQLLAAHFAQVERFASKMCRHTADAEDVTQETLIAAARTVGNFRGDAAVSTWLFRIARSFCIKQRRRGRSVRQGDTSLDDAAAPEARTLADATAGPEATLNDRQLGQALQQAIESLAPMYREVLLLRDVEGLSANEVSEVLGIRVDAVKTRLHRARLAVRDKLAPMLTPAEEAPAAGGSCPDVLSMYSRHMEGDIQPNTCAEMEAHLASCPRCQGRCDSLRRTLVLCKSAAGPTVPVATQQMVRVALQRALMKSEPE